MVGRHLADGKGQRRRKRDRNLRATKLLTTGDQGRHERWGGPDKGDLIPGRKSDRGTWWCHARA